MKNTTYPKGNRQINTFELKGERFVILKKEHWEELRILLQSVMVGEKFLQNRKTRSFAEFIKVSSHKHA